MICRQFTYSTLLLVLITAQSALAGTIITADTKPVQCVVTLNNSQVLKDLNSVWHTNDSCIQHSCELDDDGNPHEKVVEETCVLNCKGEYEYRPDPSKCCGTCVKTKCLYDGRLYAVGDTWHNNFDCTILECSLHNGEAMISAYGKVCPPVPADCPQSDLYQEDCCTYCRRDVARLEVVRNNAGEASGFLSSEVPFGDKEYYRHHPCVRDCSLGDEPMVCKYTFVVEWYETLSKACYNCPHNVTDCSRPHCITADGVRRSVTVVNRMMPGPHIEVCVNDTLVVDVKNHMLGESTTIHWHGLHQEENPYMDGVPHVSQCPIQPHSTFRYKFRATNAGTHFWHSHTGMQRGDGCFGALIIREPKQVDPHGDAYDFDLPEHRILIQDWAHQPGVAMFASHHHSIGDNKPPNILINGRGRYYPGIFKETNQTAIISSSPPDLSTAIYRMTSSPDLNTTDSSSQSNLNTTVSSMTSLPPNLNTTSSQAVTASPISNSTAAILTGEFTDPPTDTTTLFPLDDFDNTTLPFDVDLIQSDIDQNMKFAVPLIRSRRSADISLEKIPLERFNVVKGFRYRFRIINAEFLNCPITISVDNHTLSVIGSDGFDVRAVNVTAVVTYAGERFDFIVNADQAIGNYWVRMKGLIDCDERFTSAFQVAVLHYEGASMGEPEETPRYDFNPGGIELNSLNKGPGYTDSLTIAELKSLQTEDTSDLLKQEADYKFFVYYDFYGKDNPDFHMANMYGFDQITTNANKLYTPQLNHITMQMPSSPLMPAKDQINDSMFCNETTLKEQGIDCRKEFCKCHHVLQVPLNSVVELILVDEGVTYDTNHPFHLHGNAFRVIGLDRVGSNVTIETIKEMDKQGKLHRNFDRPPTKDTVTVPDGGYTIVRFKAYNPGYWLLHCHIEFHAEIGMALVIKVGEHHEMVPVPKNFPQCSDYIPGLEEFEDTPRGGGVINVLSWILLIGVFLSLSS